MGDSKLIPWLLYSGIAVIFVCTIWAAYYYIGTDAGLFLICIWCMVRAKNEYEKIAITFLIDYTANDAADVMFSNPFVHNWSKTIGVIVSVAFIIYQLYKLKKKK